MEPVCYTKTIQHVIFKCLYLLKNKLCLWSQIHMFYNTKNEQNLAVTLYCGLATLPGAEFRLLPPSAVSRSIDAAPTSVNSWGDPSHQLYNINKFSLVQFVYRREKMYKVQLLSPSNLSLRILGAVHLTPPFGCPSLDNKNRLLWHTLYLFLETEAALWGSVALPSWWMESMYIDCIMSVKRVEMTSPIAFKLNLYCSGKEGL